MAWITPVTDRGHKGTRTTYSDMNRICGNVNWLWATSLRTDFANTDIVTKAEWYEIVDYTNEIAELLGITEANYSTIFSNLNTIEAIAKAYWDLLPLFPADDLYPSDTLYPR